MKIFFAVYILLIAGVFSLAFLVPGSQRAPVANTNQRVAAANIPTSLSAPTTTPIKHTKIAGSAQKTPTKSSVATSTPLAPAVGTTSTSSSTPLRTLSFSEEVEQEIHILVNAARAENALAPLVWDSALTELAREHSLDMQSNNYFAHDNLLGCSSSCRISASGYLWKSLGENIYTMSGMSVSSKEAAEMIVEGWLKSPGHRANILSTAYTNQGVGVAVEGKTLYATEDFAQPR